MAAITRHRVGRPKLTGSLKSIRLRESVFNLNRNKETETSKHERIPKTDGRSMKYCKTGNRITSTFVKLSFLPMSVVRKFGRRGIVMYDFRLAYRD